MSLALVAGDPFDEVSIEMSWLRPTLTDSSPPTVRVRLRPTWC
ncbi:MAG: hypothetical protein R3F14_29645 [Polyangiaceae bacterium]